jgi:predicted phage tail protein
MLRTVKVYGHLAEHCGQSVFEALVRVPADAIKFLLCNFPELRGLMRDGYYKVAVGKYDLQLADHPEQLHYPMAADDAVKIIPVVSGAGGRGGLGQILLGAALITAAVVLAPVAGGAGVAKGFLGATGTGFLSASASVAVGSIGLSLALGGIATLLTPVPEQPDSGEGQGGFAFSGLQNTSQEGIPVPVVYGEMIVGSVVLSTKLVADLVPNE